MLTALISRLRASVEKRFPERHIYIRTHGEVRGLILTPTRQLAFAIAAGAIGLWTSVSVVAMLMAMSTDPNGIHAQHARAYERLIADSRGRLAHEGVPVMANADAFEALTNVVEKRQETLVKLYASVTCHSDPVQGAAISPKTSAAMVPTARLRAVQANQDKLVGTLDSAAKPCADRVRQAIRVAGLNPDTYAPPIPAAAPTAPRAQSFTERVQRAFADMTTLQVLADAASSLPFNRPTNTAEESSGFGPRIDPITGEHSNHPGVDFPAPRMTAVFSTAPGVVSFTGVRPGLWQYGGNRSRSWRHDAVRAPRRLHGQGRRESRPPPADRRHWFDRPFHRTAFALRGSGRWPTAKPRTLPQGGRLCSANRLTPTGVTR